MVGVSECLMRYVRDVIALSRVDISAAVKSRKWFLDRMQTVINQRVGEPSLHPDTPFLPYGSYAKGTKVAAVDEFDIMVRIDSHTGVFSQKNGVAIADGQGTVQPNNKYDPKYFLDGQQAVSPVKILNWLRSVAVDVVKPFNGEVPERDGPAVTVYIKATDLRLDLVPGGVFVRRDDRQLFYNIPRGVNSTEWILTAPELDMQQLDIVAADRPHLKSVIRICKRIKDRHRFGVSSFAIETSIVGYARSTAKYHDFHSELDGALHKLANDFLSRSVADPFDGSINLLVDIAHGSLDSYVNRINEIRKGLMQAESATDDQMRYDRIKRLIENE